MLFKPVHEERERERGSIYLSSLVPLPLCASDSLSLSSLAVSLSLLSALFSLPLPCLSRSPPENLRFTQIFLSNSNQQQQQSFPRLLSVSRDNDLLNSLLSFHHLSSLSFELLSFASRLSFHPFCMQSWLCLQPGSRIHVIGIPTYTDRQSMLSRVNRAESLRADRVRECEM